MTDALDADSNDRAVWWAVFWEEEREGCFSALILHRLHEVKLGPSARWGTRYKVQGRQVRENKLVGGCPRVGWMVNWCVNKKVGREKRRLQGRFKGLVIAHFIWLWWPSSQAASCSFRSFAVTKSNCHWFIVMDACLLSSVFFLPQVNELAWSRQLVTLNSHSSS